MDQMEQMDQEKLKLYQSFQNYSFQNDQKYQAGVATLAEDTLETRIFYFKKFIGDIDLNDYLQWQQSESSKGEKLESNGEHNAVAPSPLKPVEIIELGERTSERLSFNEIIEMVQSGKEIKVNQIELKTHDNGSQSVIKPRPKPWEQ